VIQVEVRDANGVHVHRSVGAQAPEHAGTAVQEQPARALVRVGDRAQFDMTTIFQGYIDPLRELDAIGVRTVVDDFGTGFAALSHLRELPVSGIKVDRTFTAGLGTDPQCDRIVEALTGLAHGLGVDLVAEGVETETQRSVLAGIGCAHAQGFLFGRPEPVPA